MAGDPKGDPNMSQASTQSYATHRRFVPLYHYVLTTIAVLLLAGSATLLWRSYQAGHGRLAAACIFLLVVAFILTAFFAREFALKAQDRAIRAEESLRHHLLHDAPLDGRLTLRQVIGLRFASDEEFGPLAKRAVEEGLSEEQIKQAVQSWRGDHERV
jgi:Family of unknown function (DUF6526)